MAMPTSSVKISLRLTLQTPLQARPGLSKHDDSPGHGHVVDGCLNQEKMNQIQKALVERLEKFGSVFLSLNMAVKWQEHALQDYKRLKAKVKKCKEKEKTGPVLAILHQAEEELHFAWADLKAKIKQLLNEMLWFYHSQRDDVQLSFESLIQAQVVHHKEMMSLDSTS